MTLTEKLEALLPQTQCRQCGFQGCHDYARAMAEDGTPCNRCAPGGAAGIAELAAALGCEPLPLDPEYGCEMPFAVARIRAADCIGCAWCIRVCPTDAIAGAPKHLHAVLEDRCTGCSLCAAACPMDAVDLVETGTVWSREDAALARQRFEARKARLTAQEAADNARLEALRSPGSAKRSALIADIMARAKARK